MTARLAVYVRGTNSPSVGMDPITPMNVQLAKPGSSFNLKRQLQANRAARRTRTSRLGLVINQPNANSPSNFLQRADPVAGAGIGVLGAAAAYAPVLAPAAAAGLGYGIYKLGEAINVW